MNEKPALLNLLESDTELSINLDALLYVSNYNEKYTVTLLSHEDEVLISKEYLAAIDAVEKLIQIRNDNEMGYDHDRRRFPE